jgi:hypothetical protein
MVKKDILSLSYKEMENHLIELIEKEKKWKRNYLY